MNYEFAIVRPPGKSYMNAISENDTSKTINSEMAKLQHAKYCAALEMLGIKVIRLPADDKYPDSCFVQDPCVVYGGSAVMTILGADSRKGEGEVIKQTIQRFKQIKTMSFPATMDGGDVMLTPSKIFIGVSKRTNEEGIAQYKSLLSDENLPTVIPVPVEKCLHLMTGVTYIGKNTVLISELIDKKYFSDFNKIYVSKEDEYAVNCLGLGGHVIIPAGYPSVFQEITKLGLKVVEVEMSEFKKADGGVTCLSILF